MMAQGVRVAIVLLIALGLRKLAGTHEITPPLDLVAIQRVLPAATRLESLDATDLFAVRDDQGTLLAQVAMTLPRTADVIGYRGPSQLMLVFDASGERLQRVELIASQDTEEHVLQVREAVAFWKQFEGWEWGKAPSQGIDAVSGATLTSLAMAESIALRVSGEKPSLRFPQGIELREVQAFWKPASRLEPMGSDGANVFDAAGASLGRVLRTGALVDAVEGYQGPAELLLAFDPSDRLVHVRLRHSFDNEPYVGYVRDETSFWKKFVGKQRSELATMDAQREGIEGVSGATMTSLAVADTIPLAIALEQKRDAARQASTRGGTRSMRWSFHDVATVLVICGAMVISHTNLRGRVWLRRFWQVMLIVYLGMIAGNLVSQALLLGWSQGGVAWRLAPGLTAIAGVALAWPVMTKRNVYCHHLCPHGAAQQLVRIEQAKQWRVPAKAQRVLGAVPGALLIAMIVIVAFRIPANLAGFEPFDAYLWRIAGWSSIVLAVGSLLLARRIPMVYCRYGCPTGRLLEYVRRTGHSARWTRADWVACAVLAIVWGRWWFNG